MLKSNIIDAKYRDAKGEYRTPSIVTSVTEDEIKNATLISALKTTTTTTTA